jgi:hypothetical protein
VSSKILTFLRKKLLKTLAHLDVATRSRYNTFKCVDRDVALHMTASPAEDSCPLDARPIAAFSLPSGTSAPYVQLSFTANTGWDAAQLSEFEIFP